MKFLAKIFLFLISVNSFAQIASVEFVENKGQWNNKVKYKAQLPGGNIYLENDRLTYLFYDEKDMARLSEMHHHEIKNPTPDDYIMDLHAFQINFLNAKTETITATEPTPDYVNYYLGNDSKKWASNVRKYGKTSYQRIYDNINLKFYLNEGYLKYDFVVDIGGEPSEIQLKYQGVEEIVLVEGALKITTSVNKIIEQKPYAYQLINGSKKEVSCNFVLKENIVSFEFPNGYNENEKLIIDPALIFASYTGSTNDDWGYTSTFDEAGHLYGGGATFGIGYPTTPGAFQINFAGGNGSFLAGTDITISKFSPDGTSLIYATYIGGTGNESPHSLIVNDNQELLIMGTTASNDYPVTSGAYDITYGGGTTYSGSTPHYIGGSDIVITKLDSAGQNLLGSTYIGGSANDGLNTNDTLLKNYADDYRGEIIIDANDNVYVASTTFSSDFPTTGGVIQPSFQGGQEGCVFKLNSDLTSLIWSTYLGGSGNDAAYSLQFDEIGNLLITGGTTSNNFPTTTGVIQPSFQGGSADGWISKINSTATSLIASTYLGTNAYDQNYFVQLDTANNVFVVGQTEGIYPITPITVHNNPNSGQFLHKLSPDLSSTIFSTTFGTGSGGIDIALSAFLVNECNYILISGWGGSSNGAVPSSTTSGLPITPNAIQATTDGSDYYLTMFNEDADSLLFATFFGGTASDDHVDGGTSRFDKKGIVYQAVCASCGPQTDDFPTTPGAWSNTDNSVTPFGSRCNLGVFKIDLSLLKADAEVYTTPSYCIGDTVRFQNLSIGGAYFSWDFGDGSAASNLTEPFHLFADTGTYQVRLIAVDAISCVGQDTDYVDIFIVAPDAKAWPDTIVCPGQEVELFSGGGTILGWEPFIDVYENQGKYFTTPFFPATYTVTVEDALGCKADASLTIGVLPAPFLEAGDDQEASSDNLILKATGVGNFRWSPPFLVSCDTCQSTVAFPNTTTVFTVSLTNEIGCESTDQLTIFVDPEIYAPNAFTPNGDGINDLFLLKTHRVDKFNLQIFDRWGELLFQTNNKTEGWNGYYKGILSKNDVYIWKLKYTFTTGERNSMIGTVTLVR
ncbi:MAG: gliding motility-associated C-terminal domain-containing protein [Vicingaceae bacterium]|nr:gliding motility-associated C-terminal domain-containing protein [Vicingaceae bacterium]